MRRIDQSDLAAAGIMAGVLGLVVIASLLLLGGLMTCIETGRVATEVPPIVRDDERASLSPAESARADLPATALPSPKDSERGPDLASPAGVPIAGIQEGLESCPKASGRLARYEGHLAPSDAASLIQAVKARERQYQADQEAIAAYARDGLMTGPQMLDRLGKSTSQYNEWLDALLLSYGLQLKETQP